MRTIDAIYEGGVLRPVQPVDLEEGARVTIIFGEDERLGRGGETDDAAPDPREAARIMAEIAAMRREGSGEVETASRDHDMYLYGKYGQR